MTEFNKNNPLGVASEGLLQNDTPISLVSFGYLKEKSAEYIGDVNIYLHVSSDISVELSHVAVVEPLIVQASSVYEFISSIPVEERGGRGFRRKRQVQNQYYIWDVPPQNGDSLEVKIESECEFISAPIYEEIIEAPVEPIFNVYTYNGDVTFKVGIDSDYDFSRSTMNLEDEMLVLLFDDLFEDEYVVSMTFDSCGDRRRKEEESLLTMMGII